jgi:uncharacterized protein YfaS (alpha-2-macroglobulin family)
MKLKTKHFTFLLVHSLFALVPLLCGQQTARIEDFSPQGTVKNIRQVRARFSDPMVPLGDPRESVAPFTISCTEKGTARWADSRNWIYDFDRDLPAGVRCEFHVTEGLKTLDGKVVGQQMVYSFSTGGPSVLASVPYQGSTSVDEDQVFILELDGDANEASVLTNVYFAVQGLGERIAVRIVSGEERRQILKTQEQYRRAPENSPHPLLLIQAKRRFPTQSKVSLVWGKEVASKTGVTNAQDQVLPFQTRSPFQATFHCARENPQADCLPISPMRVSFSAPVLWTDARKTVLRGSGGRTWQVEKDESAEDEKYVQSLRFAGPFPEKAEFQIELATNIKDDAGRQLENASRFPLSVRTGEYPPLAKFAADFGILELNATPMLPVTLRNVEPKLAGQVLEVAEGQTSIQHSDINTKDQYLTEEMRGMIFRVPTNRPTQILYWLNKLESRRWEDRERSILSTVAAAQAKPFSLPKLHGAKAFEVVGIPLPSPGFYIVEIKSELLGAALLGAPPRPMFVPTAALVTNLSVHFKWGLESSLVWVTTLDKAKPVSNSKVQIQDCQGNELWQGSTDSNGVARIDKLPERDAIPKCSYSRLDNGLFVTARLGDDMAFVHSSWNEGIESWRFQLPTEYRPKLFSAHTIFDRSLFRAGETVHMKHLLRQRLISGFGLPPESERPGSISIRHVGSEQKYDLPVHWDAHGIAESTWTIPKGAKLGSYEVFLETSNKLAGGGYLSGEFRVEEYRVPLMKGAIVFPSEPLVSPSEVRVDLGASYLAGGGAGLLPVKFRYQLQPRYVPPFDGFEDFLFSNGAVKEGVFRDGEEDTDEDNRKRPELKSTSLTLDHSGSVRTTISRLSRIENPMDILGEFEFRDPNGEIQTVSSRVPLWPAHWLVGIKPDSWALSKESLKFQVAVTDLAGKPVPDTAVVIELYERKIYSHRKRLVGGFYAFEHSYEVKRVQKICEGKTNQKGVLFCQVTSPVSGSVILQAAVKDQAGLETRAHQEIWVAGENQQWFRASDDDRIDLLPEKKRYEVGEKARFQVRMPFAEATALITVEREGVGDAVVQQLSGKEPVIEIPVKRNFAPNVYVSVLVLRGRITGVQPTATVDLGRPAYKLGIAEIAVGWRTHELKVKVTPERLTYKIREKAKMDVLVRTAGGEIPAPGSEVAIAAVDEGLLELMPNRSWNLLEAMMGRRAYGVQTSTAQSQVIGKRHFGLKALPSGGGGGRQITRELFDTLLFWKARVPLDNNGEASVEIPLNDSLTSFRIVAVANSGLDQFGTGSVSIRSTQDLMLLSGIAPVVRQGDQFLSEFSIRNTTDHLMDVEVSARINDNKQPLTPARVSLKGGESKNVTWNLAAPAGVDRLRYELDAKANEGSHDRLAVEQKVLPAVPVRVFQATMSQLDRDLSVDVERPLGALADRGGIQVIFRPTLIGGMSGVTEYMRSYPYICLEQEASRAIALRDEARWNKVMEILPSFLDSEGLAKYFPSCLTGSDVLTSYLLAIAQEAGWKIPGANSERMISGLKGFVEGRVVRYSSLPTTDLSIRKVAAIEALSRLGPVEPGLLSSIVIEPNLWPTSAVIDWFNIFQRLPDLPRRVDRLKEAEQILRSRLNFQGTTMGFSTERTDFLWWLMVSNDCNAVRLVLSVLNSPGWKEDLPRVTRGALGRQRQGRWDTTVANAWGVLAMEKFSKAFESASFSGMSTAALLERKESIDWNAAPKGGQFAFPWPSQRSPLSIVPPSSGKPWVTIQSLAAIPLKQPLSTGYKISKTLVPVEQSRGGPWRQGDIVRVRLQLEAQADMTWVVVNDPIPTGATLLGTGLGRDSSLATQGESQTGWVWPAFEERSQEAFRAYYEYVPKGEWSVEYTMRLNNQGLFNLPPTRVEAMYSPEMLGEIPNEPVTVVNGEK